MRTSHFSLPLLVLSLVACSSSNAVPTLDLQSSAFSHNGVIPEEYTCDGKNAPIPLALGRVPAEAKALALLMDDLDTERAIAVQWMAWNIDPKTTLIEGETMSGAVIAKNTYGQTGYTGPCPDEGETHRYVITVYAVDRKLALPQNATRQQLKKSLVDRVLARGELTASYTR
jgi:Raf kinase inhibitor-like YbhB/YbcL family protein